MARTYHEIAAQARELSLGARLEELEARVVDGEAY